MARFPDDDLGPLWLRDYGSIEADLQGMQDFANALREELERNYLPHREKVNNDMLRPVSAPTSQFVELVELLHTHRRSQAVTTSLLTAFGNAAYTFSAAAMVISEGYGDADGLAVARAKDIEAIIIDPAPTTTEAAVAATAPTGATSPTSADPTPAAGSTSTMTGGASLPAASTSAKAVS